MHGNTQISQTNLKTRSFDNILKEIRETVLVHTAHGTIFGGVHFELTNQYVTECLGGPDAIAESDLPQNYTTYCDPRLNKIQSLQMAFDVASMRVSPLLSLHKFK